MTNQAKQRHANNNVYLTHSIVFYNKGKMITILILLEYKICHSAKFLKISSEQTVTQMLRRNNNRPLYLRDKMMGVTCYFITSQPRGLPVFWILLLPKLCIFQEQILMWHSLWHHVQQKKRFFFQNGLAIIYLDNDCDKETIRCCAVLTQ